MERYQGVMVALSESVIKSAYCAPWRRTDDDVISGLQCNQVIAKTMHGCYKITMDNYHEVREVMVAQSESVMKKCVQRP